MEKHKKEKKKDKKEETASESGSDDGRSSESGSGTSGDSSDESQERSSRRISGDRSETTDSEEIDPRDEFLREVFHEKPVNSVVTEFVKKVRRKFLGTPFPKEERVKLNERYYCSREDYKLFSAPTVTGL